MSNLFYNLVWTTCWPAFGVSSSPIVLHRQRVPRTGPFILAANHLSAYDVPCLMKEVPRVLDFVSIVELFRNPLVLFTGMGAMPLDRSRRDSATTRQVVQRLRGGRVVAMFPEGHIRTPQGSVLAGGTIRPGIGRIAHLADVPVVPCVILGTGAYCRFSSWLPLRRVVYGVSFGQPLRLSRDDTEADPAHALEQQLIESWRALHRELEPMLPAAARLPLPVAEAAR
jgi:1-acyl-sn-glycerol-3-phosphate acyltransferase